MSATPTRSQLASALAGLSIEGPALGRALVPDDGPTAHDTRLKARKRLLSGSHAIDVDRLGAVCRELGITVTIGPRGVSVGPASW